MFQKKSTPKNYEERPKGAKPNIILIHYTGMQTALAALDRLSDPESKVSAHYLILEDGDIHEIVSEDKRAWHAGVSYWRGETDINSYSIGIEMVNPGHEFGYKSFPKSQMESLLGLCKEIKTRWDIEHVLGHSDVAPERKQDPGELFDWEYLASHGVGLWPNITDEDIREANVLSRNDFEALRLLALFGYNPMAASLDVVTAFHRHYFPDRFKKNKEDQICEEGIARLLALLRQSAQ